MGVHNCTWLFFPPHFYCMETLLYCIHWNDDQINVSHANNTLDCSQNVKWVCVSLPCRKNYAGNHNYNAINRSCQYLQCVLLNDGVCVWVENAIFTCSHSTWFKGKMNCSGSLHATHAVECGLIIRNHFKFECYSESTHKHTEPSERVKNDRKIFGWF